jgi:2-C-methyl-D-erythritol 2,4-cyclodiphosphate synthase
VVGNVDVVVNAEEPALAPHLEAMSANVAAIVGAPVSVKPKRGEGVGTVGRGEAIAVWAVALLHDDASPPRPEQ